MGANAKAVAIGVVPMLLVAFVALVLDTPGHPPDFAQGDANGETATMQPAYFVITMALCAFVFICAIVWALLWLENILAMCLMGGVVAIVAAFLSPIIVGFGEPEPKNLEAIGFMSTAALSFVVFALILIANVRLKLVPLKPLLIVLAASPIIGTGLWVISNADQILYRAPQNITMLSLALPFVLLIIITPFITGPALTHRIRYKK